MRIAKTFLIAVLVTLVSSACMTEDINKTRMLAINHIEVSTIPDGTYYGEYSYSNVAYRISVTIMNFKYTNISALSSGDTKQAKMAEGVFEKILFEQRNDVDVVSGATTTSKAFLKAIENALNEQKKTP